MGFSKEAIHTFQQLTTPFYYYDLEQLENTLSRAKQAADKYGYIIHYAMKANANDSVLQVIQKYGFGADCVSGGEIKKAIEAGFPPEKIVFAGVGKSDLEIREALEQGIFAFNCESLAEIEVINEIAEQENMTADIALRINPDIDPETHHYITTGLEENKFGIVPTHIPDILDRLEKMNSIRLKGIHFHIGSQIRNMDVFKSLGLKANDIQSTLLKRHIIPEHVNVGGGLGIAYDESPDNSSLDFENYFRQFHETLELQPEQSVHFELGRALVAHCGSLISKVLYVKHGVNKQFVVLDAGMTELIRPALYQAFHTIENLTGQNRQNRYKYDIVGPVCESADVFGKEVELPETRRNDIIAIRSAGAYGEVMASKYNLRDFAKNYYTNEDLGDYG